MSSVYNFGERFAVGVRSLILSPHVELLTEGKRLLLAGGWCHTPKFLKTLDEMGYELDTLPYPWDDRQKYRNDFYLIISLYEYYLSKLSANLSRLNSNCWTEREWRVLIGPALYTLISHLFEKWRIAQALREESDFELNISFGFEPYYFTKSYTRELVPDSQEYNHYILTKAIRAVGVPSNKIIYYKVAQENGKTRDRNGEKKPPTMERLKSLLVRLLCTSILSIGNSLKTKLVVAESYLPKWAELFIAISCGGIPLIRVPSVRRQWRPETALRENLQLPNSIPGQDSNLTEYISESLRELLPTFILEGFPYLQKTLESSKLPRSASVIYTANAFQFNELFQLYIVQQIYNNSAKLVIGQHGGVTGILYWSFGEMHQKLIADRFLSWGASSTDRKTKKTFVFQNLGKQISPRSDGGLLLTTVPMRIFHHKGGAWPVGANQSELFLREQLMFYRALPRRIQKMTTLRIFSAMDKVFQSNYVDRWLTEFPDISIDPSVEKIDGALRVSRIFVYTYNSTGYLESIALDFPTVIFWNEEYFESSPAYSKSLAQLEEVGIFHRSALECTKFLAEIWDNVPSWWNSKAVMDVRRSFCSDFCQPAGFDGIFKLRRNLVF